MSRFIHTAAFVAASFAGIAAIAAAPVAGQVTQPVQSGGAAPAFTVKRSGPVSGGRSMILIPGLLSGSDVWDGTVERFRGQYDMHVLNLAGFAGVPASGADPFLSATRDAIIAYIRDNKLDHPVIMGHSLGGFLAFWIAASAPGVAGPVVAVDGVPYLGALGDSTMTPEKAKGQAAMMRTAFSAMTQEGLGAQSKMAMTSQVKDTAWQRRGAEWGAKSDGRTAGNAIAEMMTTDIRGDVSRITQPVLLLMSGNGMTPDQQTQALTMYRAQVAGVKNATVVPFASSRHFIMLDEPALFYTTVAGFLDVR